MASFKLPSKALLLLDPKWVSNRYDAYKDSGIDWIGEIPSHWGIIKLKYLTEIINGSTPESDKQKYWDGDIKWITPSDISKIEGKYIYEALRTITEEGLNSCGTTLVPKGTIILTTRAPIGNIVIAGTELCTNQGCKALLLKGKGSDYFYYQLIAFKDQLEVLGNGSTFRELSTTSLKNLPTILPSEKEQFTIANYLDKKTSDIDKLIQQKETLLDKLQQKRQAIINEAVAKGINPNAEMKDCGIEWLGQIPKHWEVKKLKYLLKEPMMYGANEAAEEDDINLPRYIRITDFGNDGKLRDDTFKSLSEDKAKDYLLNEGDILFARSGATAGKTFQFKNYSGKACFAGYLIKGAFSENKIYSDYIYAYTKSSIYENWKDSIFIQSTIQNISAEKYKNLYLPVPPLCEQKQILNHIEMLANQFEELENKIVKQMEKLHSYRQALISEVVTGKMKVM